jgi:bis(5'-nucleosyl)-tetraphosphatase (symmetrical)
VATWVIGDIHGCFETLERLLERIRWNDGQGGLWLVGDLVNRGPRSLEVLRWAWAHRDRLTVVLGNHDLHLLMRAAGISKDKNEDTLDEVLEAPDRERLLAWLRSRPLVHRFGRFVMVHAGLAPDWTVERACDLADQTAAQLSGPDPEAALKLLHSFRKERWRRDLTGERCLAAVAAVCTRMRMVGPGGRPHLDFTGSPDEAPDDWRPWFADSAVIIQGYTVLFGHWARLGFGRRSGAVCLDSGCVYGGSLTALRLDDGRVVHEPVADPVPVSDSATLGGRSE